MKGTLSAVAAMMVIAVALVAMAAEEGAMVVKVGHGEVNWTGKTITVTGSCAPNLKGGAVPAQVRLQTERCAEMDAYRKLLEIVKGVNVDSQQTVGAQMQATPEVKAKVEGIIKGMKRVDTQYYADGGVDVVVQMTMDGPLTEAVIKPPEAKPAEAKPAEVKPAEAKPVEKKTAEQPKEAAPAIKYTGLIVDARGLKVVPALSPKLLDESGKEIYGADRVEPEVLKSSSLVAYFLNVDSAKKNPKVTDNPLVLKASKVADNGKADLVLSKDDAAKLQGPDASYLKKGRVVVVVD
jgi:hypothetical protein